MYEEFKPSSFLQNLKIETLPSVLFIYGEEIYDQELIVKYLKKICLNKEFISLDYQQIDFDKYTSFNFSDLENILNQPPFMSPKRLIIIKNSKFFKIAEDSKKFLSILENIPRDVCVVFLENKLDEKLKKFLKNLNNINIINCKYVDKIELQDFLRRIFNKYKIKVQNLLLDILIQRCNFQKHLLVREAKKLILAAQGLNREEVDKSLLENLAIPDLQTNIFDFVTEIMNKRFDKAYKLVLQLEIKGEEAPLLLLTLLSKHLRNLLICKTYNSTKNLNHYLKLPSFVLNKLKIQSNIFSLNQLLSLHFWCYQMDVNFKKGIINSSTFLPVLIAQIKEIML